MAKLMFVTAYPYFELQDKSAPVHKLYSEVYEGLELQKGFIALNYFTWFLFRRFLLSLCIVFFFFAPLLQLGLHIFLCLLELVLLLKFRTFKRLRDVRMLIFNTLSLLLFYILVGLLYFFPKLKLPLGWCLIAGIILVNCSNFLLLICFQCQDLRELRRLKKEQQKRAENQRKYLSTRKIADNSSLGAMIAKEAWAEPKVRRVFQRGSKEEKDYIERTFFCKFNRPSAVKSEAPPPSFFHPLAH